MIIFHRPKGRPSGIQPKEKKVKKNTGFSIIIRDKSKKVSTSKVKDPINIEEKIKIINTCIKDKKLLEFEYVNKQGQSQIRNVEPYEVKTVNGSMVLYGLCLQNEGIRMFIVANMQHIKLLEINGRSNTK